MYTRIVACHDHPLPSIFMLPHFICLHRLYLVSMLLGTVSSLHPLKVFSLPSTSTIFLCISLIYAEPHPPHTHKYTTFLCPLHINGNLHPTYSSNLIMREELKWYDFEYMVMISEEDHASCDFSSSLN